MNKSTFWQIIDEVRKEAVSGDQDAILKATQSKLVRYPPEEIADWANIQRYYIDLADTHTLYAAATIINEYVSDDLFIDFRSWLISQGREVYMRALENPDTLAELDIAEEASLFEAYGYVASLPYSKRTFLDARGIGGVHRAFSSWLFSPEGKAVFGRVFDEAGDYSPESIEQLSKNASEPEQILYRGLCSYFQRLLYTTADIHEGRVKRPLSETQKAYILADIVYAPDYGKLKPANYVRLLPELTAKYSCSHSQGLSQQ